jgi:hypothetical protein
MIKGDHTTAPDKATGYSDPNQDGTNDNSK